MALAVIGGGGGRAGGQRGDVAGATYLTTARLPSTPARPAPCTLAAHATPQPPLTAHLVPLHPTHARPSTPPFQVAAACACALAALAAVPCSPAALRFQKHLGRLWPLRVAIGVVAALFMARDAERREGRGGEGLSFQAWRAGVAGRGSRSGSAAAAGLDGVSGRPEEQGQSPTMLRGRPWRWEAARSRGQASHHPG